ncbi:MAG: ATP-binding protein [Candidatus Eiseniibacteriota bacterium]|jgi:lon-related putative ATP-dependent protease
MGKQSSPDGKSSTARTPRGTIPSQHDGGTGDARRGTLRRADRAELTLDASALRWRCDPDWLDFDTTAQVEPIAGVIGQDCAIEALRFGLEVTAPGQNIFVRGLSGTGRMTLVRQLMSDISPSCTLADDRCYVHGFTQADRPMLIGLPRGQARTFSNRIEQLIEFIRRDLMPALSSESMRARRSRLDERAQSQIREIGQPLEEEMKEAGLALVPVQMGDTVHPAILPVIDGKPATAERFQELRQEGTISDTEAERIETQTAEFEKRFEEVGARIREMQERHRRAIQELYESEARRLLLVETAEIETTFSHDSVKRYLDGLIDDLVTRRLKGLKEEQGFLELYRVNVVLGHEPDAGCPIIIENTPTLGNLLGTIERELVPGGGVRSNHMMIKAGSLLRADGGFLLLEARDVIVEPGAWKVLMRTLRTGKLEIVPSELSSIVAGPMLKPEAIDINVKVILLGDPGLYYLLDAQDPDFPHLFKVLADFETTIERTEESVRFYAGVLARILREEGLSPFTRDAVAAITEYGSRIAASQDRLTTRFGRLADVAREAAFVAGKAGSPHVAAEHIRQAILDARRRADLPARRFRTLVKDGTIRLRVEGEAVGQVHGLAVVSAGPLTYGFPNRITATIGPGTAGTINIDREAQLSGAIHTKGFYILGGLLRHLLRTRHPLAFSASVAFEQSYGGIDGDSASGAEICCLLSALTDVPIRQDLAMTGAIDQVGQILPVGAVTEKVEGFFDTCQDLGLTGTQGVLIPAANAGDLMLRPDVVEACRAGRFHVYAVDTIHDALELLTGCAAGSADARGDYPSGTLLGRAVARAGEFFRMAAPRLPGSDDGAPTGNEADS